MSRKFKRSDLPLSRDGLLEIAKGNQAGHAINHKFGANSDVGTSEEDIWTPGAAYSGFLTTATIVEVASTAGTDDDGAAGAQKVVVQGLDSNFDEIEEEITLDGTNPVDSTKTFIRVNRMYVSVVGTYHGSNAGTITCKVDGAGALLAQIEIGAGQTEMAVFTIPNGKRGYLLALHYHIASAQTASLRMWQVPNADDGTTPFSGAKRLVFETLGVEGRDTVRFLAAPEFAPKTDLWMAAIGGAAGTDVIGEFDIILVDE